MQKSILQNMLKSLGENTNTPTIAMCAVAIFKGIFRPTFTMMDKQSDPETKKYAAVREGITEVAALPLYAATPFAAVKIAQKIATKMKNPDIAKIESNAKFLGLGIATLAVPAVCNIIQPPMMNAYQKHQHAKKMKTGDLKMPNYQKTMSSNSGMKV